MNSLIAHLLQRDISSRKHHLAVLIAGAAVCLLAGSAWAQTTSTVTVNATSIAAPVPPEGYGVDTAVYDNALTASGVGAELKAGGVTALRYPGGSYGDAFNFISGTDQTMNDNAYLAPNATFGNHWIPDLVVPSGAAPIITVNYGSNISNNGGADPSEAASWVQYANVTNNFGVVYWEIGNEIYGNGYYGTGSDWEYDLHYSEASASARAGQSVLSPTAYGTNAAAFIKAMKAVDPNIKCGVFVTAAGSSWALNWNQDVLSAISTALDGSGYTLDFVILHYYPNGTDAQVLASQYGTNGIAAIVNGVRSDVNNYYTLSNKGSMEILITESGGGSDGLARFLFATDEYLTWFENGISNVEYQELHNGVLAESGTDNTTPYGPWYSISLNSTVARPGDNMVTSTSSNALLRAHGVSRADGKVGIVLINDDPNNDTTVSVRVSNATLSTSGTEYNFGNANFTNGADPANSGISESSVSGLGNSFTVTVPAYSATALVIPPAPTLTVAANNATRAYNTANPTFTGTVTGAQNGDTFTESFTTTATTISPVGTYAIVPTASGTDLGNYTVVTDNGTLTVTQASQTITFGAIGSKVYGSGPFAVSATSSAGASYPVTITVQSGPATIAGGTVTLTGVGTVVLKASQPGDTNNAPGTATQSFAVTPAQLTATANNASRVYNTANPAFGGTVTGAVGSDTFTETFTTTATTTSNVGTYNIVPAVTGTNLANYTVNAVNGTLTVTGAPTTTTLTAPATASGGNSVALTATVASTDGTPGGTVTFYSGTTPLGTGTLNTSGAATLTTTTLAIGTDSLSASYPATGNFAASTSAPASINVSAPSQTIAFAAITPKVYGSAPFAVSAASSLGNSYPVTITVQSGPASITGGTVTVNAVGTVILLATQAGDSTHAAATATQSFQVTPAGLTVAAANASRAYGAANPTFSGTVAGAVGNDSFTETFTTTATSTSNAGTYPIVPEVTGPTANYTVTVTNGTLTVTGAATTTTVSAPSTANSGAIVTITATVASGAGTPGGTVTFTSGTTALGTGTLSGGAASVNTTALPAGTDTVTATYAAAGNFGGSSGTATVNVSAPPATTSGGYAISASPSSLLTKRGSAASTMLTLTPSGGYTGTISLSCTGLPFNASCSFAQSQINLTGNNQAVSVGLSITTVSPSAVLAAPSTPATTPGLLAMAFYWPGGLTGIAVFLRKRKSKMPRPAQLCLLLLCTCAFAAGLSGCGMSSTIGAQNAQVTVVATGTATSGTTTQSTNLSLTVTPN